MAKKKVPTVQEVQRQLQIERQKYRLREKEFSREMLQAQKKQVKTEARLTVANATIKLLEAERHQKVRVRVMSGTTVGPQ